jgi:hypothetical protein
MTSPCRLEGRLAHVWQQWQDDCIRATLLQLHQHELDVTGKVCYLATVCWDHPAKLVAGRHQEGDPTHLQVGQRWWGGWGGVGGDDRGRGPVDSQKHARSW